MAINRNVLGRGGGFRVTGRSTWGEQQVVKPPRPAPTPSPTAPPRPNETPGVPLPEFTNAPVVQNRYSADPVGGWRGEFTGGAVTPDNYDWFSEENNPEYNWLQQQAAQEFGGNKSILDWADTFASTIFDSDAFISGLTDPFTSNEGGSSWDSRNEGPMGGYVPFRGDPDASNNNDRGNAAATARLEGLAGKYLQDMAAPDEQQIQSAIDSGIAQFEVEKALLEAKKGQALADGLEGVADQFNDQILQHEKAIQKMKDEIALTNDIEGWYRKRIKEPYEQAIAAAEAIDFEKTLAVQSKYRNEQAQSLAETEQRLNGVLADIGFTPDQITAFQGERAADNEVTAAQNALLEASGVRKGELDWEKKLKASMAEEEWMRSNRQSSGRQMITAEQNRKAIGETEDRIGELNKLKQKAMDRVRRAVDREFQGAEFPSKDEFVNAALESMRGDLYGDLPPAAQEMYDEVIGAFIHSGRDFSQQTLTEMLANGELQLPGVSDALGEAYGALEDEWERAARTAQEAGLAIPEFPQAEWERIAREIVNENIDAEDRGIIKGMVDTYNGAVEQYGRYTEERVTKNYSNAENANPQNIADAKAGKGAYGERVQIVNSMVPVIEGLWGVGSGGRVTDIQGHNYFRPSEDPDVERKKGRSPNSDHKTAGALDLFLDANNPQDMAYYKNVMLPKLREWQDQGLISSVVHLGANAAHDNHVHISFALPNMNDQGFNPTTVGTGGGDDWLNNVDQGLRGPIGI